MARKLTTSTTARVNDLLNDKHPSAQPQAAGAAMLGFQNAESAVQTSARRAGRNTAKPVAGSLTASPADS